MQLRALVAPVCLFALGCAGPAGDSAPAKPALRALGESAVVEAGQSDEAVGREIRRRLELTDPAVTATVIVEVSDGVVTLRGSAPSLAAAWQAEAAAATAPGVKQVRNELIAPTTAGP